MTRTKIICTIGPAVSSYEKILELIHAGMNVARLNFSHGTHEEHQRIIDLLKKAREELKIPLAIMLDTKGPEIRIGKIEKPELFLPPKHRWHLVREKIVGDLERVSITPGEVLDRLPVGTVILFDNGYIISKIVEITPQGVIVEIENGGVISSNKGINIPDKSLNLPAVTEQDVLDIRFGCQNDIEIIAASFVRSAEHVLAIREILESQNKSDILIVAKIENSEGVQNFDSIVQVADGIMIARGDLGVEVPLSQVPRLQKMMIRKSSLAGKPTVTATQMLESMITNSRPTRAEASDVANAIYDSTSAVMLSGETAVGKYPIETVKMMHQIVREAENDFNYQAFFSQHSEIIYHDVPSAVTLATVKTAYSSNAKAIFAFTSKGSTARLLSRLRPQMPIVALTPNQRSFHQLSFFWGVIPVLSNESKTVREAFEKISVYCLNREIVSYGDLVLLTAGSPFGISGTTNMMIVENIGDVLVRGHMGIGQRVHGKVTFVLIPEHKAPYSVRGQMICITKFDHTYLPLLKECAGVILQNHLDDVESEKLALEMAHLYSKPLIVRADGAYLVLKEGQLVTLDTEKALIYKGVVQ